MTHYPGRPKNSLSFWIAPSSDAKNAKQPEIKISTLLQRSSSPIAEGGAHPCKWLSVLQSADRALQAILLGEWLEFGRGGHEIC